MNTNNNKINDNWKSLPLIRECSNLKQDDGVGTTANYRTHRVSGASIQFIGE